MDDRSHKILPLCFLIARLSFSNYNDLYYTKFGKSDRLESQIWSNGVMGRFHKMNIKYSPARSHAKIAL